MKLLAFILFLPFFAFTQPFSKQEIQQWEKQSKNVTIIRDNWGIPHIYGKTDADAVFGLLYAQCEDDFKRVEMNYIEKLGRLSEIKGEGEMYNDLLIRLMIDSSEAKADYNKSPLWLKKLLDAYAAGINHYLHKNPSVKPALLHRFKPWFPLLWTDGSIGAISTGGLTTDQLKSFYSGSKETAVNTSLEEKDPTGSNGFAFSPTITASGKSILYINPHVTFYFRPEVHMVSEEGLNVYGAVTWGQFFIYQGFNEKCGWMHTSSDVDVADVYAEKISKVNNGWKYEYEGQQRNVSTKNIVINYTVDGSMKSRKITGLYTHHGPIMGESNNRFLALKANNRSLTSLIQSWQRTKAKSFMEYKKVMGLRSNTSNNTVYADAEGNIAYWHGNFIPVRDVKYDWRKPVDGTTKATEWKGLHSVEQSVHVYNPKNGWLQNCNSTPFSVAGKNSPTRKDYPFYMAPDGENFRGINANRVLPKEKSYTLDKVIAAGYDRYMAAFEKLVPALVDAFDKYDSTNIPSYPDIKDAVTILKNWNLYSDTNSIATTIAIQWGLKLLPKFNQFASEEYFEYVDQVIITDNFVKKALPADLIEPLKAALADLIVRHGSWKIPWGEINRFQRASSDISQVYTDAAPSLPVPFTASSWGMLPAYASIYFPNTNKRYGTHGNSFICAVEFGDKIKAKSLLAGGQSGDINSKHFSDQALMYTKGIFKDVNFYKADVMKNAEETYKPGDNRKSK